MNVTYLIYQAERRRSAAEQRAVDTQAGELAAALTELGQSLRRPFRSGRRAQQQRPAPVPAGYAIPRQR
jgi:hypothetical protein